jgi:hypothetical protein
MDRRTLEMLRNPGGWPLRVLPLKRERGETIETGFAEPGEVVVRYSDGAVAVYRSFEEITEDGWEVD